MNNGNYPNDFEEKQPDGGQNMEGAAREDGQGGAQGQNGYGSYQNRQDSYQYRNYYSERYRGDQNQGEQGGCQGNSGVGYGYQGSGGHGNGQRGPGKKNSKGRIIAAVVLIVVFVGFCGGISWLAVNSLQEQLASAAVQESQAPAGPDSQDFEEAQPQAAAEEPVSDGQGASEGQFASGSQGALGGQIASAGTIRESGSVTAVVTDVTDVVEKVMPACVSITNNYTEQFQDFWGQSYSRDEEASGSGIIIGENDTELLIVSNNHVVDGADALHVQFIDGAVLEAQVKGVDSSVDLAVVAVKLEDIGEETKRAICIAQMGDSDHLKIGEPAIAIGNALGYGQSVTTGVISALNRTLEVSETGTSNALIQTDAAINPGNSGGALLNINGEVVGINSNKIGSSLVEGMGYAIPISTARPIIEELMTHETKSKVADEDRGYLGISCINVTSEITETFSMPEGIFVAQVYEGTGADRAGLVRGDIITAIDGTTVRNQEELTKQLSYYKAGETVEITIMQGSPNGFQAKNVQITLSTYDEVNEGSLRSQEQQEQSGSRQWRLP